MIALRTFSITLAAALSLLVFADTASAGISAAKANKRMKAARKARVNQVKNGAEVAMEELSLAVRQLEIDVEQGQYSTIKLQAFVQAYSDAQSTIQELVRAAGTDFLQDAATILVEFTDNIDHDADLPRNLRSTSGGTLDTLPGDLLAALDPLYAKLRKRLAKTAKIMADAGIGFAFRVGRPMSPLTGTVDSDIGPLTEGIADLLGVDGVFATSQLGSDDDGVAILSGMDSISDTLHVAMPPAINVDVEEMTAFGIRRWVSDPITGLAEGNHLAQVYDAAATSHARAATITFLVK